MEKATVVLFPCSITMGHAIPFMDLAYKLIASHGFFVTIITTPLKEAYTPHFASYLHALSSSHPLHIRLVELPLHGHGDGNDKEHVTANRLLRYLTRVEKCVEPLQRLLRSFTSPICAFITDFFHIPTLDATAPLSIPTYVFSTCSLQNLSLRFYIPKLTSEDPDFADRPDALLQIPGMPPIAARDLPSVLLNKSSPAFLTKFLSLVSRLGELKGIMVNSFAEMEEKAIHALQVLGQEEHIPPVYPIGPLLLVESRVEEENGAECMEWLDKQAESSVLYVSFGSRASVCGEQIREIAFGLERSCRRFVWVLGGEGEEDGVNTFLLPEGFESRVGERGMVVRTWAPQMRILSHASIGGFVSHCGWNSTLESVWFGVPVAAWPLHAEQRMNSLFIVKELQVGLEVKKVEEEGGSVSVTREEVQRVAEELIGGEEGKRMKMKARELSKRARAAVERETGSSFQSLRAAAFDFANKQTA